MNWKKLLKALLIMLLLLLGALVIAVVTILLYEWHWWAIIPIPVALVFILIYKTI